MTQGGARYFPVFGALGAALLMLGACAGGDGLSDSRGAAPRPSGALKPAPVGALPPPVSVFMAAASGDVASRAHLDSARREAGLPSGPEYERISFLDMPREVLFAAPSAGLGFAMPALRGAPFGIAEQVRAAMVDALGGPVGRARAYLAAQRFLLLGALTAEREAASARFTLEWTVSDISGAPAGIVRETWSASSAGSDDLWTAVRIANLISASRRSAERLLEIPALRSALSGQATEGWVGFGDPNARRYVAAPGGRGPARTWPGLSAPPIAISAVRASSSRISDTLQAAIGVALADAGGELAPPDAVAAFRDLYEVAAEVRILRRGATDEARILWRVARDGRALGVVRQTNIQPRGAFDGAWGPMAARAAQAAAPELLNLVHADDGHLAAN